MKGDPAQVLDVLRDVLLEHMDTEDLGPWFRVEAAVRLGRGGLLLRMRDGSEHKLTLEVATLGPRPTSSSG